MPAFLIWEIDTKKIYCSMPKAHGTKWTLKGLVGRFKNWETKYNGRWIEFNYNTRQAIENLYIDKNDNVVHQTKTSESNYKKIQDCKIQQIKRSFLLDFTNPLHCNINGTVYEMDAGEYSAAKLNNGILLAEMNNLTTMDIRDFHNVTHPNISLIDVREIARLIGNDYVTKWNKKHLLQDQVYAVTVDTPDWENAIKGITYE